MESVAKKGGDKMTSVQIKVPNWLDFLFTCPLLAFRLLRFGYTYRRIPLGEGRFTIVSPRDFYWLNNFHWFPTGTGGLIYAVRHVYLPKGRMKMVRMHREIMNFPKGLLVDHQNNNTLDNRRANLRLATSSQNLSNRRINKSKSSSQFRGVRFRKERGRWSAQITCNGKAIWLGNFDSETNAARAYDAAAKMYHKEFARLNFPEGATVK